MARIAAYSSLRVIIENQWDMCFSQPREVEELYNHATRPPSLEAGGWGPAGYNS